MKKWRIYREARIFSVHYSRVEHRGMNVLKAKETTNAEVPHPPKTRFFITVSLGIQWPMNLLETV